MLDRVTQLHNPRKKHLLYRQYSDLLRDYYQAGNPANLSRLSMEETYLSLQW